ncbi:hypothetical protein [Tropicimonas marinistellae]|uniref:hypothetical protein n=1 Tax=Tropicimonas marinistellae TaxID=1739787 RepID=UPI00082C2BCA|nr:hypothetical protein [Tropicimonas marinistellae]
MDAGRTEASGRPTLHLFGTPHAVIGTETHPFFDRAAQIVGILALAPDQMQRRAHVAETIWGDPQAGLTNLRQALARFRRKYPAFSALIEANPSRLRLVPGIVDTDVAALLARGTAAGSDAARPLPTGAFLDGVDTPSHAFEEWLRDARQTLDGQRLHLASAALDQATRYGHCEMAQFERLVEQLKAFDDGGGSVDATIAEAARRIGLGTVAASPAPGPAPDTSQHAPPPRLALLRPQADRSVAIPLERFVGDVADRLSRFRSFATLAPFSSFAIAPADVAEESERLNIAYVAETQLRYDGDEPMLAIRLISASDARIVWAAEFSLAPETLADSCKRLAQTVAASLADHVEADLANRERAAGAPGAYLHFLTGREQQLRGDLPALRRARNSFRATLRADPGFAIARARIAETLVIEWILRGGTDGELLANAHNEAQQARQIDPGAAEAHWIMGSTQLYRREYDAVVSHFETARALAPHSADLLLNFADALSHLDAPVRAESLFQKAVDLNPMPPDRYWWFGASIALARGDFDTAATRCDRIMAEEVAVGTRTTCYALNGQDEKAAAWAHRLRDVLPNTTVAELSELIPGPQDTDLHRHYREGLRIAGFI